MNSWYYSAPTLEQLMDRRTHLGDVGQFQSSNGRPIFISTFTKHKLRVLRIEVVIDCNSHSCPFEFSSDLKAFTKIWFLSCRRYFSAKHDVYSENTKCFVGFSINHENNIVTVRPKKVYHRKSPFGIYEPCLEFVFVSTPISTLRC